MQKSPVYTQMLYYCTARLQPVGGLFFQSCNSQFILVLLYESLNRAVSRVKLWTITGAIVHKKGCCEFCTTAAVGPCWMQDALVHSLSCQKKKLSSIRELMTSNIRRDTKISKQYCPSTFTPARRRTTPTFDTVTNTVIDLVLGGRCGAYILQDAVLPSESFLMHTVDHFDSQGVVQ